MKDPRSRREFLTSTIVYTGTISALSPVGLLTACKPRNESALLDADQDRDRSRDLSKGILAGGSQLRMRASIFDPANKENIDAYVKAFNILKAESKSWEALAAVHQGFCPHGNWFFLPWHRIYLYHFERVIAEVSGKADFALPYWDWDGNQRNQLPPAALTNNGLFWQKRNKVESAKMDPDFVGPKAMDRIRNAKDFLSFGSGRSREIRGAGSSGLLESMPHNRTHVFVGGDMGTFLSPRDPVFWMHHCNVDRVWAEWQASQKSIGRAELPPEGRFNEPKTSAWLKTPLMDGYVELASVKPLQVRPVTKAYTVAETITMSDTFGYTYDTLAKGMNLNDDVQAQDPMGNLVSTQYSVNMELPKQVFVLDQSKTLVFSLDIGRAKGTASDETEITGLQLLERYRQAYGSDGSKISSFHMNVTNVPIPRDPANTQLKFYLNPIFDEKTKKLIVKDEDFLGAYAYFVHHHDPKSSAEHTLVLTFDLLSALGNRPLKITNGKISVVVKVFSPTDLPDDLKTKLRNEKIFLEYVE